MTTPIRLVRPDMDTTNDTLRDEDVLNALVANKGLPQRAAAALNTTEEYILTVVSRSVRQLSTKLRGRLMLSSFTTVMTMNDTLQANMDEMTADTLGKTYAASLAAFSNLAGQFEEQSSADTDDDAGSAKEAILERLKRMNKNAATASEDAG